jgi:RNA polymerase sigma factor (sigma-70 family)
MEPQRLPEVIAQAQAGQARAFEALLEAYSSRLYGYFLRAVGNHHDAEDLLGEMAVRLVSRLATYDDRGRFEPWLLRLAANPVRDRLRRLRTSPPPGSLAAEHESGASMGDRLAGEDEPVERGLVDREASGELAEAMSKLDELTRQMIILRHYGELSYREIAEICECPVGTVLARVHRGLKALRRHMGGDDDAE